jgi:hypothetical protein
MMKGTHKEQGFDQLWKLYYCDDLINEMRQQIRDGMLSSIEAPRYAVDRLCDIIAVYEAILSYEPYCMVCDSKLDLESPDLENQKCSLCKKIKKGIQSTVFAICPNGHHVCDDCRVKKRKNLRNEGTPERAEVILTERQADVVVGYLRKNSLIQTASKLGVSRERARLALSGRTRTDLTGEEQLVQQGAIHKIRQRIQSRRKKHE